MSSGRRLLMAAMLALGGLGIAHALLPASGSAAATHSPNVVFILTDDQTLAEMSAMPRTAELLGGGGTTFDRAYVSYPLCCPSRTTMLTGQYMHNHDVRGNLPPSGGWERFTGLGEEAKALPVWLHGAGYRTVQLGKYLNGYPAIAPPVPPGWDEWYGKLSQYSPSLLGNQIYFNYSLLEQGPLGPPAQVVTYGQDEDDYQTDVLVDKSVDAIRRFGGPSGGNRPFFIDLWLSAPHAPYIAAPRHVGAFDGASVPLDRAVNERKMGDKPRFLRRLPRLRRRQLTAIQNRRRARDAQLLSVDEGVASIVEALRQTGELDNTYIFFTSDNGYFSGEHRIAQGKYLPFEPSSHVPLLVRGPGIPAGGHSAELVSNVDFAPTIAAATGVSPLLTEDGRSLLPYARNPAAHSARPLLLEGDTGSALTGGEAIEASSKASEKLSHKAGVRNLEQEPVPRIAKRIRAPAYRAIRTDRYLFVRYAKGGNDLYDMSNDPLQLRSRRRDPRYRAVRAVLGVELRTLQGCAGSSCSLDIGPDPAPLGGAGPQVASKQNAKRN